MHRTHRIHAGASSAPDNLIENPLDKPKRDDKREHDRSKPGDPGDNLIPNPIDKDGAGDKVIPNPLDKR